MISENIPLTEANPETLRDEQNKQELKNRLKTQYREMIKTIDEIYDNKEPKEYVIDLEDGIRHFDIDKIYCNCCGFSTLEQNIKKTTFYIFIFIFNIVLVVQMSLLLTLYLKDRHFDDKYSSSSFNPHVD